MIGPWGASVGAAPLISGNFAIADKLLHGDGHVLIVGDSEQNSLVNLYGTYWQPDKWTGVTLATGLSPTPVANYADFIHTPLITSDSSLIFPLGGPFAATPPDGITGISPGAAPHVYFSGTAAPAGQNMFYNRTYEADLLPSATWMNSPSGNVKFSTLFYMNPDGVAPGFVTLDARTDSLYDTVASAPISTQAAKSGFMTTTLNIPTAGWTTASGHNLAVQLDVVPGTSLTPGKNVIIAAQRASTGEAGFQMADIHMGGVSIDYFLDPATCSDAALAEFLNFSDTNIAYIWIGQNGSGETSPAAYEVKVQRLLARYRSVKPGIQFVLVSTYDTGGPNLAGYADALNDIAQQSTDVLFLNLFQMAGSFATLDANYLQDHVHENAAGSVYMAQNTATLLHEAAALVPEPTGAALIAIVSGWQLTRRARRRRS